MKEQAVSIGAVDLGEQLSQSDEGVDVSENCAEKLRSSGESNLDWLADLNQESVTRVLGEGESQKRVAPVLLNLAKHAGVSSVSHAVQKSTPVGG